ncbi:unnamed protein product [Closterium sp. Naga37s-1]|nr:unnamed protein product [Closterium sp. Naga37s-1]
MALFSSGVLPQGGGVSRRGRTHGGDTYGQAVMDSLAPVPTCSSPPVLNPAPLLSPPPLLLCFHPLSSHPLSPHSDPSQVGLQILLAASSSSIVIRAAKYNARPLSGVPTIRVSTVISPPDPSPSPVGLQILLAASSSSIVIRAAKYNARPLCGVPTIRVSTAISPPDPSPSPVRWAFRFSWQPAHHPSSSELPNSTGGQLIIHRWPSDSPGSQLIIILSSEPPSATLAFCAALSPLTPHQVGLQILLAASSSSMVIRASCALLSSLPLPFLPPPSLSSFSLVVGVGFPVFRSFKAIEEGSQADRNRCLAYWSVYGCFRVVETITDRIISWLPFYQHIKLLLLLWLQLPSTSFSRPATGAGRLYASHLRPVLLRYRRHIDGALMSIDRYMDSSSHAQREELMRPPSLSAQLLPHCSLSSCSSPHPIAQLPSTSSFPSSHRRPGFTATRDGSCAVASWFHVHQEELSAAACVLVPRAPGGALCCISSHPHCTVTSIFPSSSPHPPFPRRPGSTRTRRRSLLHIFLSLSLFLTAPPPPLQASWFHAHQEELSAAARMAQSATRAALATLDSAVPSAATSLPPAAADGPFALTQSSPLTCCTGICSLQLLLPSHPLLLMVLTIPFKCRLLFPSSPPCPHRPYPPALAALDSAVSPAAEPVPPAAADDSPAATSAGDADTRNDVSRANRDGGELHDVADGGESGEEGHGGGGSGMGGGRRFSCRPFPSPRSFRPFRSAAWRLGAAELMSGHSPFRPLRPQRALCRLLPLRLPASMISAPPHASPLRHWLILLLFSLSFSPHHYNVQLAGVWKAQTSDRLNNGSHVGVPSAQEPRGSTREPRGSRLVARAVSALLAAAHPSI